MLNKKYIPFMLNAMICAILLIICDTVFIFSDVPGFVIVACDFLIIYLIPKFLAKYFVSKNKYYAIQASFNIHDKGQYVDLGEADMRMVLNQHFVKTIMFWALFTGGLFFALGLSFYAIVMISTETLTYIMAPLMSDEGIETLINHPLIFGTAMTILVTPVISYVMAAYISSKKMFNGKMIKSKFFLV